tara:strand:- start:477 stop:770 length:294 start_codon:yes stop_codon:yes gene_type:complete
MGLFLMAFSEDLDTFFVDFTEDVIYESIKYKGILEQPDELIADGVVMTTDYELTVKTSELGDLKYEAIIEVNDIEYKVRNARKIDDGILSKIALTKV